MPRLEMLQAGIVREGANDLSWANISFFKLRVHWPLKVGSRFSVKARTPS